QNQGLVKHVCCSFHDNNVALRKIVDSGMFEAITLQYNILDRQLEDGIAHAHAKGVGVVVMGPVAGGRLGTSSDVLNSMIPNIRRLPELALRFVLANPNVSVALSGMSEISQVDENAATASDPSVLSQADLAAIDEHLARLKKMADLYCTGCGYCMPCPNDVQIPKIFDRYNRGRVYGLWDAAKAGYAAIGASEWEKGNRADACIDCGACETKCPQKLPIRKQLKEAHAALKKD
ncbi:MAG: aldo/keto reductase, partial [Planctomycetaceae bacterium]